MSLNPYLSFDGQCKEAFEFYEKTLGAKITFMTTWGEMPEGQCGEGQADRIMHATLKYGEDVLMGADSPPEFYSKPQGISVSLHFKDAAEGERVFQALSEEGNVIMPFQKTFWAAGFGMCTDKYSIPWMVNAE